MWLHGVWVEDGEAGHRPSDHEVQGPLGSPRMKSLSVKCGFLDLPSLFLLISINCPLFGWICACACVYARAPRPLRSTVGTNEKRNLI